MTHVAVVTGGASGIGRALVELIVERGDQVVVADVDEHVAQQMLDELGAFAEQLRYLRADVSHEPDVAAVADLAVKEFGQLDAWFNNAGVTGVWAPVTDIDVDEFDRTIAVLLRSCFLGIKHAARQMIPAGNGGAIVNTASVAGVVGGAGPMAYSAAKAGVVSLTRSTAVELSPHRIRVNAVLPGAILTPMMHGGDVEGARRRLEGRQPWPEHGRPEHVASVMAFLASADAEFVTGESMLVDGGLVARGINVMPAVPPPNREQT